MRVSLSEYSSSVPVDRPLPNEEIFITQDFGNGKYISLDYTNGKPIYRMVSGDEVVYIDDMKQLFDYFLNEQKKYVKCKKNI